MSPTLMPRFISVCTTSTMSFPSKRSTVSKPPGTPPGAGAGGANGGAAGKGVSPASGAAIKRRASVNHYKKALSNPALPPRMREMAQAKLSEAGAADAVRAALGHGAVVVVGRDVRLVVGAAAVRARRGQGLAEERLELRRPTSAPMHSSV